MSDQSTENLKTTLQRADRYLLLSFASALVFLVLSLPSPQRDGSLVRWQLLGVPLEIQPQLALVGLYFLYIFSALLADNMVLHARDLVLKSKDKPDIEGAFAQPTVLTVSPIGRFVVTVVPAVFLIIGLSLSWIRDIYNVPGYFWVLISGFALLAGLGVYVRARAHVIPHCIDAKNGGASILWTPS